MSLKSISSFIASVLLIGFTIASGIIIYYFLTTLPRVQTTEISSQASKVLSCAGATFDVKVRNCNLLNGLVLWLPMDEGSGTIAYDYSGYGNNGTLYNGSSICGGIDNCPLWVDGIIGKAISFDGVDDYVNVPAIHLKWGTIGNNHYTYVAWINLKQAPSSGSQPRIVLNKDFQGVLEVCSDMKFDLWVYNGTQSGGAVGATPISLNRWYFVVVTFDRGNVTFYLNGSNDGSGYSGFPYTGDCDCDLEIGAESYAPERFWNGTIDDVRIYNRALTDDEIKQLYYEGLTNKFNITIGLLNSGYADLDNSFTAIVYLKNGTILQLPLNLDKPLSKGYYLEGTVTIDGYYPSYGLVDKIMVCSNDCQGVCSEIIVNNQC
jgi:hypothetical protein